METTRAGLSIEHLTFQYPGATKPVLHDVSIEIPCGAFFLLCGASGCGKTTLLRCLKPSMTPYGNIGGRILWRQTPLDTLSLRSQTQTIGFVQQNPDYQIVTDKVWHELAFGMESLGYDNNTIRRRIAEMASFFGIQHWFHMPVSALSGGQKQILNLAAVMVMEPEILILDEPTAQLDPIAAHDFLVLLHRIQQELGTTVILSEHRLEEAMPLATCIAVLDDGQLMYHGAPSGAGAALYGMGHGLYQSMPCAVQVQNALDFGQATDTDVSCPVTVTQGKQWLTDYAKKHKAHPIMHHEQDSFDGEIVLSAKEVWYRYEKAGEDIVKGLSLQIPKGTWTAILGANGTGKTTALKVLAGLYKPYRGTVQHSGSIAILPQNPQTLFVGNTVLADLHDALGTNDTDSDIEARIQSVAEQCQIRHLLEMHPYDLSGGEQQRAALAKLLLRRPDILLLDEPTKGCDAALQRKLASILQALVQEGMTVVMVSHDIEFCARYAQQCMMFFDGMVIAQADTVSFFADNCFYTTAASRMSKHLLSDAILPEHIIHAFEAADKQDNQSEPMECVVYTNESLPVTVGPSHHAPAKTGHLSYKTMVNVLFALILIPLTVYVGLQFQGNRQYYVTSILVLIESMIPFVLLFEGRKPLARELVIVSVLCALAIAGRAIFFMFPQIKPVMAVVILAGAALGCETGVLTGAVTMLVSNLLFAQGPWTPWQMFAMGLVGFVAGILFHNRPWQHNRVLLCSMGLLGAILIYGVIMNLSTALLYTAELSQKTVMAYLISGFPMDCMHGISTCVFLWIGAKPVLEKLERLKYKYGCFL